MPRLLPDSLQHSRAALIATAGTDSSLAGAVLLGRVNSIDGREPLLGVEVRVVGMTVGRYTDTTGSFGLLALPAGRHELIVRRFGFEPARVIANFEAGRRYTLSASLLRVAPVLTEVRIEGVRRKVPPYLEDAYRRGARGWGKFITAEDIRDMGATDITSVLIRVPGVHASQNGFSFPRCGGYGFEAIGWGAAKMQVYIDGVRVTQFQEMVTTFVGAQWRPDVQWPLKSVNISQVQAIEVYTGASRIPGEFLEDACAVIAIWTKRG